MKKTTNTLKPTFLIISPKMLKLKAKKTIKPTNKPKIHKKTIKSPKIPKTPLKSKSSPKTHNSSKINTKIT